MYQISSGLDIASTAASSLIDAQAETLLFIVHIHSLIWSFFM